MEGDPLVFLIRRAKIEDVGTLLKLAKMVHFINLPAERDIITSKVMRSREGFLKALNVEPGAELSRGPGSNAPRGGAGQPHTGGAGATNGNTKSGSARHSLAASSATESVAPNSSGISTGSGSPHDPNTLRGSGAGSSDAGLASQIQSSDLFMFVLEDLTVADDKGGGILGTSQIITRMGGPGRPNVSFKLSRKEMFSSTLQVGATHILAKLFLDESGPTEIGGLILQPSYRGHKLRLGRFLSLVRFHVMGLYRELFSDRVLAEMMGPLTPDGHNTMWEYLGRRFINLTYAEADSFCQYSKEFMTSLLPREEIYLTLLPPEARAVIGQVGPETMPARKMLEKLGFQYRDHIDPFDGGPHLEAMTNDITIVRNTQRSQLGDPIAPGECDTHGFVSVLEGDGEFRAIETDFAMDKKGRVCLTKSQMKILGAQDGMMAGLTIMDAGAAATAGKRSRSASQTRK
ncbi:MAG: arginine N-succinyltransferase [Pyrinomonadaceae bacterium]|nr:arginine N-succinyltransferase [Phycisphaerales bacterium]